MSTAEKLMLAVSSMGMNNVTQQIIVSLSLSLYIYIYIFATNSLTVLSKWFILICQEILGFLFNKVCNIDK